jgi:hypothetical protein
MMNNKKGQTLSINTIIITILAIFVLVILVVALTGGTGNFIEWWNEIWGSQAIDAQAAVLKCDGLCTRYDTIGDDLLKQQFCTDLFEITSGGESTIELTCAELVSNGKVSCPSISC